MDPLVKEEKVFETKRINLLQPHKSLCETLLNPHKLSSINLEPVAARFCSLFRRPYVLLNDRSAVEKYVTRLKFGWQIRILARNFHINNRKKF